MAKTEVTLFSASEVRAETRQAARVVLDRIRDVENGFTGLAEVIKKLPASAKGEARTWAAAVADDLKVFIQALDTT